MILKLKTILYLVNLVFHYNVIANFLSQTTSWLSSEKAFSLIIFLQLHYYVTMEKTDQP